MPHRQKKGRVTLTDAEEIEMLAMLRALKQVVAEVGDDYRYPISQRPRTSGDFGSSAACWYVYQDRPDCIAGRVLFALGMTLDDLRSHENVACDDGVWLGEVQLSHYTLYTLRLAQITQDTGKTWGDARDTALEFAYTEYGVTTA